MNKTIESYVNTFGKLIKWQYRCRGNLHKAVDIADRYRMDRSGCEPRLGQEIFSSSHPSRPILRPALHQAQLIPGLCPGGKTAGACWPPTPI